MNNRNSLIRQTLQAEAHYKISQLDSPCAFVYFSGISNEALLDISGPIHRAVVRVHRTLIDTIKEPDRGMPDES